MSTTLEELARLVGGTLHGPGDIEIHSAEVLGEAHDGCITMLDRADRETRLDSVEAAAVVAPKGFVPGALPAITVDDVYSAFTAIVLHFRSATVTPRRGIHECASVSPTARLGEDVEVHCGAVIGERVRIGAGSTIHSGVVLLADCEIAENVTIFPSAVLYENTRVGPRSVIHAGAVIGAHGFGYRTVDGRHIGTAQLGFVEIGADVEIGACTTIDRGTYGPTRIGEGTKIDNQVMIAHNCRIGRHNMLCSQVGIAGSTSTGDYVVMAGQVGVRDHVHIGERAILGAKAGVSNDVAAGSCMIGIPATPERDQKIKQAVFSKLPEMRRQLKAMQTTVDRHDQQLLTDASAGADVKSVNVSKKPFAA